MHSLNTLEIRQEINRLQTKTRAEVKELKKLLQLARLDEMRKTGLDPLSGKGRQYVLSETLKPPD